MLPCISTAVSSGTAVCHVRTVTDVTLGVDECLTRTEYMALSDDMHREILVSEFGDGELVVRSDLVQPASMV
jgi:hypothetical protein